jgi:hypothetical protein
MDIVLEDSVIAADGKAGASSRRKSRYRGARDGRRVGCQAAADRVDRQLRQSAKASRRTVFYGFEYAARNDILLYAIAGVPSAWVRPDISLQIQATPREVSPSSLCFAPHSPFLTIAFFLSPKLEANEPRITPPFFQA